MPDSLFQPPFCTLHRRRMMTVLAIVALMHVGILLALNAGLAPKERENPVPVELLAEIITIEPQPLPVAHSTPPSKNQAPKASQRSTAPDALKRANPTPAQRPSPPDAPHRAVATATLPTPPAAQPSSVAPIPDALSATPQAPASTPEVRHHNTSAANNTTPESSAAPISSGSSHTQASEASQGTGGNAHTSTPSPQGATVELPSSNADYLNNPKPVYPAISRRLGEQGQVILRVFIGTDGSPQQAEIHQSSGFERLDQAGLKAVMSWRFVPGKRAGQPTPMWAKVPIQFSLK